MGLLLSSQQGFIKIKNQRIWVYVSRYPHHVEQLPILENIRLSNRPNTAMKSPGKPKINVKNASKSELM